MKKTFLAVMTAALLLSSCGSTESVIIPRAINTIGTATLKDLNLQRDDYQILKTVTAEAAVVFKTNRSGDHINIRATDDDFELDYTKDKKKGWQCSFSGIAKAGYLGDAFSTTNIEVANPSEIAYRLAIYRLINQVQATGGDGMVAPTVQTRVEQEGKNIHFLITASAKAIKLKTN